MTVIDRDQCEVGKKFAQLDSVTEQAVIGTVIETKLTDDGRKEAKVRFDDGVVAWLPTYRATHRT